MTISYAWHLDPHGGVLRFMVRFCQGCHTNHVVKLHYVDPELAFCLSCLSQMVIPMPDGAVLHMECQNCGASTAVELDDPFEDSQDEDEEFGGAGPPDF
jgi:hypothetical protein